MYLKYNDSNDTKRFDRPYESSSVERNCVQLVRQSILISIYSRSHIIVTTIITIIFYYLTCSLNN